jgi:hypothetical protein
VTPNYISVIGPKRAVAPYSSNVRPRREFLVKKKCPKRLPRALWQADLGEDAMHEDFKKNSKSKRINLEFEKYCFSL